MKRAVLYLRVSTDGQNTANQKAELEAVATHRGWKITQVYEDAGISGAKGRDKRPGLDAMLKDATRHRFDVVMAWSVDRLGRSLIDLVSGLQELHNAKIDLFLQQQAVDTTTPGGKAMFQMLGVFAEFERSMIQSRVKAGLARVKAEQDAGRERFGPDGRRKKLIGRPGLKPAKIARITQALADGMTLRDAGVLCGVSSASVLNVKKTMEVTANG